MITIVIPVFNEEKEISSCLNALTKQETNREFEVIIVNNNSTDKTIHIINKFQSKLQLKIYLQKRKGRGAARQMGFSYAKGDIILSTDADTIVPSCWLETLVTSLQNSNAIAVTGPCKIVDSSLITNKLFNILQPFFMRLYRSMFGEYWLSGFNFAIYKNMYIKSGGFNTKLNAQEDIELSFKVRKIGRIQFIPNLPVIFSGRRFKRGLIIGLFPYVTTFAQLPLAKLRIARTDRIVLADIR